MAIYDAAQKTGIIGIIPFKMFHPKLWFVIQSANATSPNIEIAKLVIELRCSKNGHIDCQIRQAPPGFEDFGPGTISLIDPKADLKPATASRKRPATPSND
ncbi:hypothetical protein [Propionivibrio sp.]|uniref:hypothetical protein n=1 Tax=Propionivibrio sp. TaxID=2212460 RepID=UPI003BF02D0F